MPGERAILIYDGACGLCRCVRRAVEPLDVLGSLRWLPYQSEEAQRLGIPLEELESSVHLVAGGRRRSGFAAVKSVLLRLLPLYLAAGMLIRKKPALALPVAVFFSPWFRPAGDALYRWISEHRHAVPVGLCRTEPGASPARLF